MPVKFHVKSADAEIKANREKTAQRVHDCFNSTLPDTRVLVFLDDEDCEELKSDLGATNRAIYIPIQDDRSMPGIPNYVRSKTYTYEGLQRISTVDDLVYLHGSSCADEVGMTMTIGHELQHVVQHNKTQVLWRVNALFNGIGSKNVTMLGLRLSDIPIEVEAKIVGKRVAEEIFGQERVKQCIAKKIADVPDDIGDWKFVQTLMPSMTVDLEAETRRLLVRARPCREKLEDLWRRTRGPSFFGVELDSLGL
jgi:hypothetical protein